jgi:hypothetical protein
MNISRKQLRPGHAALECLVAFCLLVMVLPAHPASSLSDNKVYMPVVMTTAPVAAPVFKWKFGGCYSSWCETGWYSSPAAVDVNGDGRNEVVASAYSLFALNGETGALIWRALGTSNRTWPGVVVADIDQDGAREIVTAQASGWVSVIRLDGSIKWQYQVASGQGELRGLLAADLDGDNSALEIVVTRAYGSITNAWVLNANKTVRSGWPQLLNDTNGYSWGVYNTNAAAGNIDGDGQLELIVPSDVHYINAFNPDGSPVAANAAVYPGKNWWGRVGVWESMLPELRGWGTCDGTRTESYRANFADGPAVISDLNGDSQPEIVVTGNMYDCHAGYPPSKYMAVFVFNPDRTRFNQGGHDWSSIPQDTGAPLSESYDTIESAMPNPAVADLDGDGNKEILYASYDGRLHAFWLDKTEHGSWPYAVTKPADGFISFASEPLVADLNADGKAEVIFTSWTQKGSNAYGRLVILNWQGVPLYELDLPAPKSGSATYSGGMAAPTLANIDGDADLELIVNTIAAGVVAYDLPGTSSTIVLWGTGRGSFTRAGTGE